jgi:hypothetical protein
LTEKPNGYPSAQAVLTHSSSPKTEMKNVYIKIPTLNSLYNNLQIGMNAWALINISDRFYTGCDPNTERCS